MLQSFLHGSLPIFKENKGVIIAASQTQQLVQLTEQVWHQDIPFMRTMWTLCTTALEPERNQLWQKWILFMRKLEETKATRGKPRHLGINRKKGAEWATEQPPPLTQTPPQPWHSSITCRALTHLIQYHLLHSLFRFPALFPSCVLPSLECVWCTFRFGLVLGCVCGSAPRSRSGCET